MEHPQMTQETVLLSKYGKEVYSREFKLPNGKTTDYLVWGGPSRIIPSIIFPLTREREVLAIRQFRYAPGDAGEVILELPGGHPEKGETDFETARKELLQETGYLAEEFVRLGMPRPFEPAACTTSFMPILALGCVNVAESQPDDAEFLEVVRLPLKQWVDMMRRDEVRDPKTVTTTMLALFYLGANISLPD